MKLHEVLAIEQSVRKQVSQCLTDLMNTFNNKRNHFVERTVTYRPLTEGDEERTEKQLSLQTSVDRELNWIGEKLRERIDLGFLIDHGNTLATADVTLPDGTVLLKNVPATTLLQLEKTVQEIFELAKTIPTLDPVKGFEMDSIRGAWRARPEMKVRTEKVFDFKVMVAATDKHPAQVKELTKDTPVAQIITDEWSSMITVTQKADLLDRIELVGRAIKAARSRANEFEFKNPPNKFGADLLNFMLGTDLKNSK